MATFYKQEAGQFHLHDDIVKHEDGKPVVGPDGEHVREQALVHSSKEVAVAYCQLPDRLHIFTHGTAENMRKWVKAHNDASPHTASLKIFSQSTPLEVLNRAFVDATFLGSLVQRDPF